MNSSSYRLGKIKKTFFGFISSSINFFLSAIKLKRIKRETNSFHNGQEQAELDKKLVFSLAKARIPNIKQFKYLKKYLNSKELWLIRFGFIIIAFSLIFMGARFYITHLQTIPVRGGEYREGLIGMPQHINPLYSSLSDVDSDISELVFSSLFKRGKNGELIKDLAENYGIDPENKIYNFTIRPQVQWHDGNPLTVNDIIFTFNIIKDKQYQSPLRAGFIGVEIEKIDDRNFKFILSEPYAAFLELLTFGILPADLWYQFPPESAGLAELNLKPIGSGPYRFESLSKDKTGNIKEYKLRANENYYDQRPYIDIVYAFFPDFTTAIAALNENLIDGISYLPRDFMDQVIAPKTLNFHKLSLPQLTAIFLNQKKNPALADKAVRQALALAINRQEIVNKIMDGDAYLIDSPILPNSFAYYNDVKKYPYNTGEADKLLNEAGWQLAEITEDDINKAASSSAAIENGEENEPSDEDKKIKQAAELKLKVGHGKWRQKNNEYLIIKLTTVERNENEQIIKALQEYWEKIGVKTELEILPASQMQTEVIKPRNFEALFYGQITGADPDPYVFWHSSQIGEDGLNITDFANNEVDELLEEARLISDIGQRREKYNKFQEIITEEAPAIFIYSPVYTYAQGNKIQGFDVESILLPSDRFVNIEEWYIKTGKKLVW